MNQSVIRDKLRVMEDARWFDESTQKIEVTFIVFNANSNLVTYTLVEVFVTRGGHWWKHVNKLTVWLNPYPASMMWTIVLDIVFVLQLLKFFFLQTKELLHLSSMTG